MSTERALHRTVASAMPFLLLAIVALAACGPAHGDRTETEADAAATEPDGLARATFAGGCFWCMEPPFDEIEGIVSTTSGYTGGHVANPSYKQVSAGTTGHAEAMQVVYDPEEVSYEELLRVFWRNVDPTDAGGQFCDRGDQYRTGIFVHSAEQERLARASKREVEERLGQPVVTEIEEAGPFYPAEEYHQDYYEKNPLRYKFYRTSCGRDRRLHDVWGDEAGGH